MSLPLHESRVLALIEMELCREDRELAARFAMFNRLAAARTPPRPEHPKRTEHPKHPEGRERTERRERPEPGQTLCWVLAAILLVSLVVLGTIAATLAG